MIAIAEQGGGISAGRHESEAPAQAPSPSSRAGIGGPKSPEGRRRASRNAITHGMRARTCLPDDLAAAAERRADEFAEALGPETPYEWWLIRDAALASVRLDSLAEKLLAALQQRVDRADLCWDDDRRLIVEDLAARLPKDPSRVARLLRGSRQGADWLIERWDALAEAARLGGWDPDQRRLALDLLGVPPELRPCWPALPESATPDDQRALALRESARLREDRESHLDDLDESLRTLTALGMPLDDDPATRLIRRYEAESRRALRRALDEFRRVHPAPTPTPPADPTPPPTPRRPRLAELDPTPLVAPAPEAPPLASATIPRLAPSLPAAPPPSEDPPGNRRTRRARAKLARQAARRASLGQ